MRGPVVAWDLDETLGSWVQLGSLSDSIADSTGKKLTRPELFALIDTFPEYLRPGLIPLLATLRSRMESNSSLSVILFTNNNGPQSWARSIVAYLNHTLGFTLFSTIIPAFEVNGRRVSKCRTSSEKLYSDLLTCIGRGKGTEVCFIDDQEHPGMRNDNVKYIRVQPYEVYLGARTIRSRLSSFKIGGVPLGEDVAATVAQDVRSQGDPVKTLTKPQIKTVVASTQKLASKIAAFLNRTLSTRRRKDNNGKGTRKIRRSD
jgi:hypothetical protein